MDGVAFLCSWCGVISFVVIVCRLLDLRFWWCVFVCGAWCSGVVVVLCSGYLRLYREVRIAVVLFVCCLPVVLFYADMNGEPNSER